MKYILILFYALMAFALVMYTARYCDEYRVNWKIAFAIIVVELFLALHLGYTILPEGLD